MNCMTVCVCYTNEYCDARSYQHIHFVVVLVIDDKVQVTYCLYKSMIHMAVPMQERPEGRSKSYKFTLVTSWDENGCTYSTYSDSRCSFMRVSAPN